MGQMTDAGMTSTMKFPPETCSVGVASVFCKPLILLGVGVCVGVASVFCKTLKTW